jgi:hypothetical protein
MGELSPSQVAGTKAPFLTRAKKQSSKARFTKREDTDIFVPIVKTDAKEQIVYGWASPVTDIGGDITDRQGDVIAVMEVRQAAHEFMLNKRVGGSMHTAFDVGQVVESVVFDKDLQKALGIDLPYEGWFIGVKISKSEDWAKVVSGEYTGFSIGGSGIREPMEKSEMILKGYAVGKNPASHGNRGRVGGKKTGGGRAPISRATREKTNYGTNTGDPAYAAGQSALSLRSARLALKSGDKGKAAHHANNARDWVRRGRNSQSTRQDKGYFNSTQSRRKGEFYDGLSRPKVTIK